MVVKTSVSPIYQCVYDGVEIGSTGVRENVELPVGETVNQQLN